MKYIICSFSVIFFLVLSLASTKCEEKKFIVPVGEDGIQRLEVVAGEYFFDPSYIVVKSNMPVEIKIKKEPSVAPHDFVLKAPDAGIDILESLSTEPKIIKFTPSKAGKYLFYCDKKLLFFKSHREKGMQGVLEVGD